MSENPQDPRPVRAVVCAPISREFDNTLEGSYLITRLRPLAPLQGAYGGRWLDGLSVRSRRAAQKMGTSRLIPARASKELSCLGYSASSCLGYQPNSPSSLEETSMKPRTIGVIPPRALMEPRTIRLIPGRPHPGDAVEPPRVASGDPSRIEPRRTAAATPPAGRTRPPGHRRSTARPPTRARPPGRPAARPPAPGTPPRVVAPSRGPWRARWRPPAARAPGVLGDPAPGGSFGGRRPPGRPRRRGWSRDGSAPRRSWPGRGSGAHLLEPRRGIEVPAEDLHRDDLAGPGVQLLVRFRELAGLPGRVELPPGEGVPLLDRAGDRGEPLHGVAHHLDRELQAAAGARPGAARPSGSRRRAA
jgi:hypothetical protein